MIQKWIVATWIVAASSLVSAPGRGPAAESVAAREIVVSIQGMACPLCAYGLEKRLEKLPGVTRITVDVGKSLATLAVETGAGPTDEEIRRAVREAGFTAGEIRHAAIKSSTDPERPRRAEFRVEGMRCDFCAGNVSAALRQREGVISAHVDLEAKRVIVEYDSEKVSPREIAAVIEKAGRFTVTLEKGTNGE